MQLPLKSKSAHKLTLRHIVIKENVSHKGFDFNKHGKRKFILIMMIYNYHISNNN